MIADLDGPARMTTGPEPWHMSVVPDRSRRFRTTCGILERTHGTTPQQAMEYRKGKASCNVKI